MTKQEIIEKLDNIKNKGEIIKFDTGPRKIFKVISAYKYNVLFKDHFYIESNDVDITGWVCAHQIVRKLTLHGLIEREKNG